jgi:predicted enzyme related to lactoylglutathione lyase
MITADTNNAPDWVDLNTPDVESAVEFYSRLLGWDVEKTATPMGDYFIARQHGHQVAGLMAQSDEMEDTPPMWTMYINVESVDITAAKVAPAGGRVLSGPFDIPDGRVAVVSDPSGAVFGIISTPLEHSDKRWFSVDSGAVCWVELLTRDPEGSEPFYASVFGWVAETSDSNGTAYTTFSLGGDQVAGMMSMPAEVPDGAPSHWMIYFAVEDCATAEQKAVELGGRVLRRTAEIEGGRFAVLEDPQSAPFQIMESGAGRKTPSRER